jgi:hypothetical protein
MGYSAPVSDLTVASLLSNYANANVDVLIVDIAPDPIVDRLRHLGLQRASGFAGSIPNFVDTFEADISRTTAAPLSGFFEGVGYDPDEPIAARTRPGSLESLLRIESIDNADGMTAIKASREQPDASWSPKSRVLKAAVEQAATDGSRLVIKVADDPARAVLHIAHRTFFRNWTVVEA